jgi:pimeloyl-ACP methyl ester carboxylesterase
LGIGKFKFNFFSMNRNLYSFGISLSILHFIIALVQGIIFFQLGNQTYSLDSFRLWYACSSVVVLLSALIVLRYFHYRKFRVAFWCLLVTTFTSVLQFIVVFAALSGKQLLFPFHIPVMLIVLVTSIAYATSLIFSDAGSKWWLKVAGVTSLIIGSVLTLSLVWVLTAPDPTKQQLVERIHQWLVLLGSIIPVFYILNFVEERKVFPRETAGSPPPPNRFLETAMIFASVIALGSILFIAPKLIQDSSGVIAWNNDAPERAMRLAEPFEARIFVSKDGKTLPYRLFIPADYDSLKEYPLVVCLHHGGSHGNDNTLQIDGAQPAQVLYQNRTKHPAILFVPQCPKGSAWGGIPSLPAIDSVVFEAISFLEAEFRIDPTRRYVTGISGGGFGSWYFATTRPDMFAAAMPVCGGGDPGLAKNMASVPVWAFHGEEDRSVPVKLSRDMVDEIKKAGGDPKYTEFSGAGHNIWDLVNANDWMDWMFSQKKQ